MSAARSGRNDTGAYYSPVDSGIPVVSNIQVANPAVLPAPSECPTIIEFEVVQEYLAAYSDIQQGITSLFVGDFGGDRILRYDVDTGMNYLTTPLPVDYGLVWLADDLDRDGLVEVVSQWGNELRIHSAPDWALRQKFIFAGNVGMSPTAVNIDQDPYLELFLTPGSLGGAKSAVIIKYDSQDGKFKVIADISAPIGTGGQAAAGDFDNDGRVEFIVGNGLGYGLFEWRESILVYIGQVGGPYPGAYAIACRPKPGGVLHALLGHSRTGVTFLYQLIQPVGDNIFEVSHVFQEYTGAVGIHPCAAADVDCDGLDEIMMTFSPLRKVWEWDDELEDFQQGCVWDFDSYGSFSRIYSTDLDQNGTAEWSTVNHLKVFRTFSDPACDNCDSAGTCVPPLPECLCVSHADPLYDGVTDVLDVVHAVEAAFRNNPADPDPGPYCPRERTDVNCDDETDVLDVVHFVNVAFRNQPPQDNFCDPCTP